MNANRFSMTAVPAAGFALAALLAFSGRRALADDPPKPMPAEPMPGAPTDAKAPPPPAGRFFDTFDANRDGKVSKEEFSGDEDTFALLDTDKDGFVTLAEMGLPADYTYGQFKQERDDPMGGGKGGGGRREFLEKRRQMLAEWDTNKDGKVSKEEYKGKIPFDLADRNKDGFVTMEDLGGMPGDGKGKMPGGRMPTLEELQARFKEQDKNGDGKVAREEFPGPDEVFKRLDKNADGAITMDEVEASMKDAPPGAPGEKGKKGAFGRFDKNGDGKVTREEFPGSDDMFKSLDKNGDGALEPSELEGLKPKQFGGKGEKGKKPGDGDKPEEPGMPPPPGGAPPDGEKGGGEMGGGAMPAPGAPQAFGALFAALDKDKDGKLSRAEFPGNDLEWKSLDKDGNGWITPEEAAAK